MLISCKCLNFVAAATNSSAGSAAAAAAGNNGQPATAVNATAAALMQAFVHKFPRSFVFYSECMDFLKQVGFNKLENF